MLGLILLWGTVGWQAPTASAADDYDALRAKWKTQLAGDASYSTSDPDIAARIQSIDSAANNAWTAMNKSSGRTSLWSDLAGTTDSAQISNNYSRLGDMALAYSTRGAALYNNTSLKTDIVGGLDWMYANRYNESKTPYGNWWDWEIGAPQRLADAIVLMYDALSAAQIANYVKALDAFNPDPTKGSTLGVKNVAMTGANRSDKAQVVALRGVVGKSSAKIAQARDALSQIFDNVTSGDGYYADGSFIQHTDIAYTGSYGVVLLEGMAKLLYLLGGSPWQVTNANAANVYRWVSDSYEPLVYNATFMDSVFGRAISRARTEPFRPPVYGVVLLAQQAAAADKLKFQKLVKAWIQSDSSFNPYAGKSIYMISLTKTIMADASVTARAPLSLTKIFASMDRAVHFRPGFAFSVSMFSNRTSAFEFGNGENSKAWWTGSGMTYLYNGDNPYSGNFWPTVDFYRLPGTTTDGSGSGTPTAWGTYRNTKNWVGGSSIDGVNGSAGMEFSMSQVTGSSLQGKKSWFMFGDKIAALGSGITGSGTVETIVDNRKLNAQGSNALTVNGTAKPATLGWSQSMTGVNWAHLAGSASGSDVGYYFPQAATIAGLRESRTGAWSQINSGESAAQVSNSYVSLAFKHGTNPSGASYAYVLLPGRSASAMAGYAANPDISILENSAAAHAARDATLGLTGINFWSDGSKTVNLDGSPYVTSDKKASVTLQEKDGALAVGVSDPTQANTGVIHLEINRTAASVVSADSGVTVDQSGPTIKLTVNVSGAKGKTFASKFTLGSGGGTGSTVELAPSADAAVRDGSYAATNYGSAAVLDVKNESSGYNRQAYLKFDLSQLQGPVVSAKLRLVPVSAGASGFANQAELLASDSWTEGGLTWNNRPTAATAIATWSVPAAGTPVEIDVTAQVNAAIADDKTLSLRISSPANVGSDGWVQYGAKENGTASNRPALVIASAGKLAIAAGAVTASGNDGNVPANTVDGSFATRWSASGDGAWIQYDLGAVYPLDRVKIAWYLGDTRTASFDIRTSTDGASFSTVYSGVSGGQSAGLESFGVGGSSARYVRIVGHGNSTSEWNSITEVEVWSAAPGA